MKRMGRNVPPQLMSRFKESLKNEQLEKLSRPCYVVDEILPPNLATQIDEKIEKQKDVRKKVPKGSRINIGFRKVVKRASKEIVKIKALDGIEISRQAKSAKGAIMAADGIREITSRPVKGRRRKKSEERICK